MPGLRFWVVTRDGKGRWIKVYDPKGEVKDGMRFEFEVRAEEYKKKKKAEDREAQARLRSEQGGLL